MKKIYGHSLLELLICLCIGCLLFNTAIPILNATAQRNQQAQLVNQLVGTLHFARSNAVMGKSTVSICAGNNPCNTAKVWSDELLVFHDPNQNGQLDPGERVLRQEPLAASYKWHWSNFRNRSFLQFKRDGTTPALNGTFTLCKTGQPIKQVVINITGRVRTKIAKPSAQCQ